MFLLVGELTCFILKTGILPLPTVFTTQSTYEITVYYSRVNNGPLNEKVTA